MQNVLIGCRPLFDRRGQHIDLRGDLLTSYLPQRQLRRQLPGLPKVGRGRREGRTKTASDGRVVKTRHGKIIRYGKAHLLGQLNRMHGGDVVHGDQRGRTLLRYKAA